MIGLSLIFVVSQSSQRITLGTRCSLTAHLREKQGQAFLVTKI